ncbi:MAG: formylglycine-generating enzyme family protein [Rhodospirillaceae bacterium]|nr:formylglycine-generating enzyme family protein [Rhodospirillaceae bacterium]
MIRRSVLALLMLLSASAITRAEGQGPQTFKDCAECPEMVVIPGGRFVMGAPESESQNRKFGWGGPEIEVKVARFALAKTEITRAQFAAFVRESGYRQDGRCRSIWEKRLSDPAKVSWEDPLWPDGSKQSDDHPVVCIAWEDAMAYAAWLTRKSGGKRDYTLPSEAQFEYAARAGTAQPRPWPGAPEESCKYANVGDRNYLKIIPDYGAIDCDDGYAFTSPVTAFPANAFGLHDLLGNVWEWALDCRTEDLTATPRDGTALQGAPSDCKRRVLRSSGYSSAEWYTRVTTRGGDPVPGTRLVVIGFRVAARLN